MGRAARKLRRKEQKSEAVGAAEEAQQVADRLLEGGWKYGALVLMSDDGTPEVLVVGKTYSLRDVARLLHQAAEDSVDAELDELLADDD